MLIGELQIVALVERKPLLLGEQRTAALAACESPSPCGWRWHGGAVTEGLQPYDKPEFLAFPITRS